MLKQETFLVIMNRSMAALWFLRKNSQTVMERGKRAGVLCKAVAS